MTCSVEEARRALARVLSFGLGLEVDRNRREPPDVSSEPIVLFDESQPDLVGTTLSPPLYDFVDRIDVALVLQDDFRGDRDTMAGQFAARVEDILAANPTLDGVIDISDCDPFAKSLPSEFFGIQEAAAAHVTVNLYYCSTRRSGGG